ncbi:hypothetical protein ACU686_22975 [Yinghuangia aomiensis]
MTADEDAADTTALLGDLRRTASALGGDSAALEKLVRGLPGLRGAGGAVDGDGTGVDDPAWRSRVFDEAVDLLAAMLGGGARPGGDA